MNGENLQANKTNQAEKARLGAIGENQVVSMLMQHGWDAFNANCTIKNFKSIDIVCLNSEIPEDTTCWWKPNFIIPRQQFIKLLSAAHDWYDKGYKRDKPISKKSPAGMKIEWLEGKDEKETDRHIAFHNPLQGISCEDCWDNIWKD